MAVAVMITLSFSQTSVAVVSMETEGVTGSATFITIELLFTVAEEAQFALLVSVQVMISPSLSVELLNWDRLVPAFSPLIFH